jgi:hypothetical protein
MIRKYWMQNRKVMSVIRIAHFILAGVQEESIWGQVDSMFVFGGCSQEDFIVYKTLYQFVIHENIWYKKIWSSHRHCSGVILLNEFEFAVVGGTMSQILYLSQ